MIAAVLFALCSAANLLPAADSPRAADSPPEASTQPAALPIITLQEALRRAGERNVPLRQAAADIDRVYGLLREIRSQSFPTLVGNASYTHLDHDRRLNGILLAGQNQIGANATISVPLFAPSRWAAWSHAHENAEVARLAFADIRRDQAIAVARAYITVLSRHRLLEARQQAFVNSQGHEHYAHIRFEGGKGTRLDDIRAQQELASSTQELNQSVADLTRAQEALGALIGDEAPLDASQEPALPLPGDITDSEKLRQDVAHQVAVTHAAEHVARDWWTDLLPFVTASFFPFYQNPPTTTVPQTGYEGLISLTWSLYDGGLRYGYRQEHRAQAEQQRLELEGLVRQARSEIRTSYRDVVQADEALRAARTAAQLAQQALDLSNLAYRAGAVDNLAVIDAERAQRDAATAAATAGDDAMEARLDLLAASGKFP